MLADDGYIKRAENILITGATGCGKSYLACALGDKLACLVTAFFIFPLTSLSSA